MFKSISNQEFEKKIEINPLKEMLLKSKVEIGNMELYKNDWLTNNKIDYIERDLSNNRYSTKGIPHLIPNNSTVELKGEIDKRPYLTSFKRDYISKPFSKNELNKDVRDMIKNSKIVVRISIIILLQFGDNTNNKANFKTCFQHDYIPPNEQKNRFNYNIESNYKFRDFSMHPIRTNEVKSHTWGYEHYDPIRGTARRISSNVPQIVHKNYYYTYDNITNRYLK